MRQLRGATRLARQLSTSRVAGAEEAATTSAATKAFLEQFAQRAPSTMAAPSFSADYRACPRGAARQFAGERPREGAETEARHRPLAPAVPKAAAAAAATGTPDKVTLNFYLPHSIEFQGQKAREPAFRSSSAPARRAHARARFCPLQVDQVSIPATTGEFGVLPGHVPTVAQLKPGVLAVHLEADKNVKKARGCCAAACSRALGAGQQPRAPR